VLRGPITNVGGPELLVLRGPVSDVGGPELLVLRGPVISVEELSCSVRGPLTSVWSQVYKAGMVTV
jgi:hypothetical protein